MVITTITTISPNQDATVVKIKNSEPATTTLTLGVQKNHVSREISKLILRMSGMINKTTDIVRPSQEAKKVNAHFVVADVLVVVVDIKVTVKITSVIENQSWPSPTFEIKLIF